MVFVFGSNLAGRHGKGAALHAKKNYGAAQGVGEGRTGMAYAIPTKDENLNTLDLHRISTSVAQFCHYARANKDDQFLLTPIGTGLAGIPKRSIWGIMKVCEIPNNVFLSSSWVTD